MSPVTIQRWVKCTWLVALAIVSVDLGAGQPTSAAAEPNPVTVPTAASPSILADDTGAIAEVLIHFPASEGADTREVIAELLSSLNPQTNVVVACPNRAAVEVFEQEMGVRARAGGRQVRVFDVGMDISIWARDRCIARQNPDGSHACLLVPRPLPTFDVWRLNELYTPFALESVGAFPDARATSVVLEGGNIVGNAKFAFVGANAIDENEDRLDGPEGIARLMRDLRQLAGKEIVVVGGDESEVPWDHVDMYLTPVAEKTVLLADPDLSAQIFGVDSVEMTLSDEEDAPFASPIDTSSILEQIAQRLRQLGFVVIRVPAIINIPEQWMVTYNNVLIDDREGRRTVIMPVYGLDALDAYAQRVYEQLGFNVKTVNVTGVYESGGALRCITNVTRRDYGKTVGQIPEVKSKQ
ncbi:MAG TPA: agmatine deiminase family protein [Phycisphaerae bacterium]|nr:agmatine deiminase family protein [Phycisphaerae bacterium]